MAMGQGLRYPRPRTQPIDGLEPSYSSWQGNPGVDPSIWFIGESQGPEWVVVRQVSYPDNQAKRPRDWEAIRSRCEPLSRIGHFASVAVASSDQPFQSDQELPVALWRGHGMHIRFTGLE